MAALAGSHIEDSVLELYDVCRIIGDQLTSRDVRVLKLMFNGIFTQEFLSQIHDGFSFLQALEKIDKIDDSNFRNVENYLRMINRHDLFQFLSLRRRRTVHPDPVTQYLEQCAAANVTFPSEHRSTDTAASTSRVSTDSSSGGSGKRRLETETPGIPSNGDSLQPTSSAPSSTLHSANTASKSTLPSVKRRRRTVPESAPRRRSERLKRRSAESETFGSGTMAISAEQNERSSYVDSMVSGNDPQLLKKKVTCDIRLRVRAEYVNHQTALHGNVHSNKPELVERQFERFMQANTILKSRDLGSIICDIKFSELTYLDAFWRDYINGSLLEALKGVFITESLKQAVGHEAIKLLVNVDEDDYEAGRLMLLQSLKDSQC